MDRLESVSPDLYQILRSCPPAALRSCAITAAKIALDETGGQDESTKAVFQQIESGKYGDSSLSREVQKESDESEDRYFKAEEAEDNGDAPLNTESLVYFSRARALSAVVYAGSENAFSGAVEAIYEAISSVDDRSVVLNPVWDILRRH